MKRTCTSIAPWVRLNCATRSSRFNTARAVAAFIRIAVNPMAIGVGAVIGPKMVAGGERVIEGRRAQSSTLPGRKETGPLIRFSRATRDGGSASWAMAQPAATSTNPYKNLRI